MIARSIPVTRWIAKFAQVASTSVAIVYSLAGCGTALNTTTTIKAVEQEAQHETTATRAAKADTASRPAFAPTATGSAAKRESGKNATLALALVGDVLLVGVDNPFRDKHLRTLLKNADLAFCNLESPLSTRGAPTPLKFHDGSRRRRLISNEFLFRTVPFHAQALRNNGIDVVSLANNHSMDYGEVALQDTFAALKRNGINWAGAGNDLRAARRAAIESKNGVRVAFLAYVQNGDQMLPGTRYFAATDRQAGVAFIDKGRDGSPTSQSLRMLREDIRAAKKQADVVVVSYHWGIERQSRPTTFQRRLGRRTIELGADAVVGHHPHCLQGIEVYNGKPIFYSLGNFVFRSFDSLTRRTGIAMLTVGKNGVHRVVFHPAYIRNIRPFSQASRAQQTVVRLSRLSHELGAPVGSAKLKGQPVAYLNLSPQRKAARTAFQSVASRGKGREVSTTTSTSDWVDIARVVPGVRIQMPYATKDNFFKTQLYPIERAFLRRGTARKLQRVAGILARSGLRLQIWDAYRPLSVQRRMWEKVRDRRYVADPSRGGSNHNRGAAVDVTLIDRQGRVLPMPTGYDDFSPRAHVGYRHPSKAVRRNVYFLRSAMTRAGFTTLSSEWWHFDDSRAAHYKVAEISLEQLSARNRTR